MYARGAFCAFACHGRHAMWAPAQAACRQPAQLNVPLDSPLIHGCLGPTESTSQKASRMIKVFLQGSRLWQTDSVLGAWIGVLKPNAQNIKTFIFSKLLCRFQANIAHMVKTTKCSAWVVLLCVRWIQDGGCIGTVGKPLWVRMQNMIFVTCLRGCKLQSAIFST